MRQSCRWLSGVLVTWMVGFAALPAQAKPHDARIPLHEGKLHVADLTAAACREIHLPAWQLDAGEINLNGWRGSLFVEAVNASLGDGCSITLSDDALLLHIDPEKLPRTLDENKHALRTFVEKETPAATAAHARRWGLFLPVKVDASRPIVILTHGLNCGRGTLQSLGELLEQNGFQVGYFCYPNDQALSDSTQFLAEKMAALREAFPGVRVNFVAHSMGGLVARSYIEGSSYGGEVDHLILVATPNAGSKWTKYHLLLKAQTDIEQWRQDPDWHASWIITEGFGEAARDLRPRSTFLKQLNAGERRPGVKYTIIAGAHHPVARIGAKWTQALANAFPERTHNWWVLGPAQRGLSREADQLRNEAGSSDGPVAVASTRLPGVDDFVLLPADHASLFCCVDGAKPAALGTIIDRLGR